MQYKTKANLRDNMTDLELIFTMLGEKMTTEISHKEKPKAMIEHKKVPFEGNSGGRVGQRLELLIEMFRLDEKVVAYAEKFTLYCKENFNTQRVPTQ